VSPTLYRHDFHFFGAQMLFPMVSSSREGNSVDSMAVRLAPNLIVKSWSQNWDQATGRGRAGVSVEWLNRHA
jgi:hypothetical protein